MSRGGKRTPNKPAAVSGPGALSARTDGGASKPILSAPSAAYGERADREAQAAAAPITGSNGGGAPGGARPMAPPGGMFDPTQRPGEPITAGAAIGPGAGPQHIPPDPDEALWVIYEQFPNDDLRALIEQRRRV
jgi:hypothetical protein